MEKGSKSGLKEMEKEEMEKGSGEKEWNRGKRVGIGEKGRNRRVGIGGKGVGIGGKVGGKASGVFIPVLSWPVAHAGAASTPDPASLLSAPSRSPRRTARPGREKVSGPYAGSPWELPPRVPTDPDVPDSGIRLVQEEVSSYAYTEWTTRAAGNG
jgi:hypothetical protein